MVQSYLNEGTYLLLNVLRLPFPQRIQRNPRSSEWKTSLHLGGKFSAFWVQGSELLVRKDLATVVHKLMNGCWSSSRKTLIHENIAKVFWPRSSTSLNTKFHSFTRSQIHSTSIKIVATKAMTNTQYTNGFCVRSKINQYFFILILANL